MGRRKYRRRQMKLQFIEMHRFKWIKKLFYSDLLGEGKIIFFKAKGYNFLRRFRKFIPNYAISLHEIKKYDKIQIMLKFRQVKLSQVDIKIKMKACKNILS